MNIWYIILIIAGMGAFGGIINCAITGEFVFPKREEGIWRPGWVGNVLVGAAAAFIVVGINGSLASFDFFASQQTDIHLTVSQIANSILVGLGGGNMLTQMAQKQAERVAKGYLASTLSKALDKSPPSTL